MTLLNRLVTSEKADEWARRLKEVGKAVRFVGIAHRRWGIVFFVFEDTPYEPSSVILPFGAYPMDYGPGHTNYTSRSPTGEIHLHNARVEHNIRNSKWADR